MIRKNKWKLIISSIITLLPIVFGLIVWNKLPKQMAIHWGIGGEADGYAGTAVVVLVLPIFLLAMNWFCILITCLDNKGRNQNPKIINSIFWIMPVLSLYCNGIIYATAFGMDVDIKLIVAPLVGIGLIVIGNILPKSTLNHTFGIKIKWTLASKENWTATHRFAGKVWVVCGLVSLLGVFFSNIYLMIFLPVLLLVVVVVPMVYSYRLYQKQLADGRINEEQVKANAIKPAQKILVAVILTALFVFLGIIMFTGNIEVETNDRSFTLSSTYYNDVTVNYSDIASVELCEDSISGSKVNGFNSARLLIGAFKNDELGNYTSYVYTGKSPCIILQLKDQHVMVIALENEADTTALYNVIVSNTKGD